MADKELWEWTGYFRFVEVPTRLDEKSVTTSLCYYRSGNGWALGIHPQMNLNNLFRYAVPKAVGILEQNYGLEALREFFKRWMHKMGEQSDHLENVDYAFALKEVIEDIIGG